MLSGNDDADGVMANMGLKPGPRQLYFTAALAVAVVNSVVGGAAIALAFGLALSTALGPAVAVGAVAAAIALGWAVRYQNRTRGAGTEHPVLFPSEPTQAPAVTH